MPHPTEAPPVFHVTHWKTGSQWVRSILNELYPDRTVEPLVNGEHVTARPIERGRIYPTVYLERRAFDAIEIPDDSAVFVVVRDLRDTLISSYYSLLKSHPLLAPDGRPHPGLAEARQQLEGLSVERGLIHLIENGLEASARIQASWLDSDARIVRFEDLVEDGYTAFASVLKSCGLPFDEPTLDAALEAHSFETRAGRPRGTEDTGSHLRKGVSGDWRNHFTEAVQAAFDERYSSHLVRSGYVAT